MCNRKALFESMIFNYETTNRTDFRDGDITPLKVTGYKEKSTCVRIRPPGLKDVHALTDWHGPKVPFDLYIKPKDTVHNDPRAVQKAFVAPPNVERKRVQQSRPRLIMTPATSLDDLAEGARELVVGDVYQTAAQRSTREAAEIAKRPAVRAPLPGPPAPANPITLPRLLPPYVSPEWRMESVKWDGNQLRSYADPTKQFWLDSTPICEICDQTAARVAIKKLKKRQ